MQVITKQEQLKALKDNNMFFGQYPVFKENTKIIFKGENNIFFCENNVVLENSSIVFSGNNSVVYLSKSKRVYKINLALRNNSVFYSGSDNYFNKAMEIIISEQKNVFLGSDGLFSYNICLRVADPHIVYSCKTKQRLNMSKSIYIGDHVWIGQDALILKGTQIGSGSIIGARAVVTGKKIQSNTSWGGVPAKQIANDVFFTNAVVHWYCDKETQESMYLESDKFIYNKDSCQIRFDDIEKNLENLKIAKEKLKYLEEISEHIDKNRFYL